jgi:AraC-like DNA-binding protein
MVSIRCKIVVKSVLEQLNLHFTVLELGEIVIKEKLSAARYRQLNDALITFGFELMDDTKSILIEKIKHEIIEIIHYSDDIPKIKFSKYLSEKINRDYVYLSNLFTEVKGMSIEQFIIAHKIERVKELLIYNQLSLTEIAWKLNYSSVGHLSNQFKKVTGLSPSHFKKIKHKRLNARENI